MFKQQFSGCMNLNQAIFDMIDAMQWFWGMDPGHTKKGDWLNCNWQDSDTLGVGTDMMALDSSWSVLSQDGLKKIERKYKDFVQCGSYRSMFDFV